jgi:hypothetical protein
MVDHGLPASRSFEATPELALTPELMNDIERSGYYPQVVAAALLDVLGAERPTAHLVHLETTLDEAMEVRRHVTVLALTPSRLLVCHTDEFGTTPSGPHAQATTTVEAVSLSKLTSVALTTSVSDPARYRLGTPPREATLTVGWGAVGRVDVEPAMCGDVGCEADHGYTGTLSADDFSLRVSEDADGLESVGRAVRFAAALSEASAHWASR